MGEAADQGLAVERLELVEPASRRRSGAITSRTSYGVRGSAGHDVVEARGVLERLLDRLRRRGAPRPAAERWPTIARTRSQRVRVVVGEVVDDAGDPGVHVAAAELLGGDHLAGGRLHQRRAAEEDRALVLDDDGLVAHRRHVGAAGGARAHHRGDLRDPARRHPGLVVEDPAEVLAVGEDLVLQRQEGAAGVDEVDAGQAVLARRSPGRAGAS